MSEIRLQDMELADIAGEIISNMPKETHSFLAGFSALLCCEAELKSEAKTKDKKSYYYDEEYNAGSWTISIKSPVDTANNARLVMKWKDQTRVNCIVGSIRTAYDYAFNILVK